MNKRVIDSDRLSKSRLGFIPAIVIILLGLAVVTIIGAFIVIKTDPQLLSGLPFSSTQPTQNQLNITPGELTPEVRQCIIGILGRAQAETLISQYRQTHQLPAGTEPAIAKCLNTGNSSGVPPTSLQNGSASYNGTIEFGTHVTLSQNEAAEAPTIQALGSRVTSIWLYPPPSLSSSGAQFVQQSVNLINKVKQTLNNIDVVVHIMPVSRSEAAGNGNPSVQSNELPGSGQAGFSLPTDMNAYTNTLTSLVTALRGKVKYYSIANEVSGYTWKGTPADYATLVRISSQTIKAADNNAVVLDSGMASLTYAITITNSINQAGNPQGALNFFNTYTKNHTSKSFPVVTDITSLNSFLNSPEAQNTIAISNGRFRDYCKYYDVLELHDYQGWETLNQVFDWINTQMSSNGCVKPIQVWELGYGIDSGVAYDLTTHAQSVAKMLTIVANRGVQKAIYFPLDPKPTYARSLLGQNGSIQPPAIAYQVAVAKLAQANSSQSLGDNSSKWIYKFTKSDGTSFFVVWANTQVSVSLPGNGHMMTATDITGKTMNVNSLQIPASQSPLFLE